MKVLKKIWGTITYPFVAAAVLWDESRRQNLDGEWDEYWARKNRRAQKREARGK